NVVQDGEAHGALQPRMATIAWSSAICSPSGQSPSVAQSAWVCTQGRSRSESWGRGPAPVATSGGGVGRPGGPGVRHALARETARLALTGLVAIVGCAGRWVDRRAEEGKAAD